MATPPPDQQWVLSATAILTVMTRRAPRYDCLGGAPKDAPDAEQTAKTILKNSWGIESREKLESTIEWLASAGHSADYQKAAASPATATPAQQQFVTQYGAQLGAKGLLAWDLGRLFAVAGWGYLAGYCNEIEAWGVSLPAAERLRATYASWEDFGQHYKLGCTFWNADAAGQTDAILGQLRAAPDSPWKTTPWALGAAAPPAPAPYGAAPAGPGPAPGASPYAAPAPVPYTPAPGAMGGAPGPNPYGAPPGVAPMAPYGAAPMAAPAGAAPGAPAKKKTGLLLGVIGGSLVILGVLFGLVWHFTHEPTPPHPAAAHDHKGKK